MHRDADYLRDLDRALADEWLLTDGTGGYASMTVLLAGTRRYHGLWVPALKPPVDRQVILAHLEEKLVSPDGEHFLSTCEYPSGFYPDGTGWVRGFDLDPLPRLGSEADGVRVTREILLLEKGQGVAVRYTVTAARPWTLELRPFLAMRSFHALAARHEQYRIELAPKAAGWRCLTEDLPGVFLWTDADAEVRPGPVWYNQLLRRAERDRGFPATEDLLTPGVWAVRGEGDAAFTVFASFDPPREIDYDARRAEYVDRRRTLVEAVGSPEDARLARLACAAADFLVARPSGRETLRSVIAGYPWFADWGRDAMIALPGLTIEAGRPEEAGPVLEAFAAEVSEGMLPNRFAEESGHPEYNTVDASLWFLQALAAYVRAGGDAERVRARLWPAACAVVSHYCTGTRFGIVAGADGLLSAGSEETQLTWMDATSGGRPVTPRYGKPVEINALWASGLALVREMAEVLSVDPPGACALVELARRSFEGAYWNDETGCLYDNVFPDGRPDPRVRPNQVFAVGLPHAPLVGEKARSVVDVVRDQLLTPRGLRTLAPGDPAYCPTYTGGPEERDAAYHQGTAWAWLLGPYGDAVMAVEPAECARGEVKGLLEGLLDSMEEAGLGHISEIFDGDPPHRPRGCIAQAWSVAAAVHLWRLLEPLPERQNGPQP